MSDKVNFALLAPSTREPLGKAIYSIDFFFDLTKISWFIYGLVAFMFFVKMLRAVNCSC